jgi:hypothetical protein
MQPLFLLLLFLMTSCSNPFQGPGSLHFQARAFRQEPLSEEARLRALREAEAERLRLFLIDKDKAWKIIVTEAVDGFKEIEATVKRKCFACHDANTKTPIYGRILTSINPVYRHQKDGIKVLDFSKKFPLLAMGDPSQISLLKAIKNEVVDRTMPIKAYTSFYPKKKLNDSDEEQILAWVDPLIEKLEDFEHRFQNVEGNLDLQVNKIFEQKCFRCHANGNDRGNFANMQDTQALIKGKFVNLKEPLQSAIYTLSVAKKMPPNPRDALSDEELLLMGEWLEKLTQ